MGRKEEGWVGLRERMEVKEKWSRKLQLMTLEGALADVCTELQLLCKHTGVHTHTNDCRPETKHIV